MPRMFLLSIVLLSALPAARSQDELTGIQRPFLWEFQAPDSTVVSYVFGTIHVNDPRITKLHPLVRDAFDSAQSVWFEIDFPKDAPAQTKAITLPEGQHLKELVSEETLKRIDARVAKLSPLMSRTTLPEFHIVMWPIALANMEAQVKHAGVLPVDMQLYADALAANRKTGGLEDPNSQLKPLLELSTEQQLAFLEASLDVMDEDDAQGVNQLENLIQLYAAGDGDALQDYLMREMHRPQIPDDLKELFVTTLLMDRNKRMVQAITKNLQAAPDDVHFIAVGTAHLVGSGSVIEELQEAGFEVRRVANPPEADSRTTEEQPQTEAGVTGE